MKGNSWCTCLLHVALLVESLSAELTRIWSSITVNEEVSRESARPLKSLSALLALKYFLDIVNSPKQNHSSLVIRNIFTYCFDSTCVDLSWFHVQRFCCKARRRRAAFHYAIDGHAPQVHVVCWTSSHIWYTSRHRRLVPWCPAAWIDDDVDNVDERSPDASWPAGWSCCFAASSDEILKCPQATVDDS